MVETPEGIMLALRPAGVVARLYAYLIDWVIRYVVVLVVSMGTARSGGLGMAFFLILLFAVEWFYPVVFELGLKGATPGKRALGLKVVMDSGLPITPAASVTRNLLRVADFLPLLFTAGGLSMLLRRDFKRLGDIAAGTLVVYETPAERVASSAEPPPAPPQAPARALSIPEQAHILALAARAHRLTPERLEELARLAAPMTGATPAQAATPLLLSVAQWLYGNRSRKAECT